MSAASSSAKSAGSGAGSNGSKRRLDPLTRTALRYTISPREYELLHRYVISRAPAKVQQRTLPPPRYERLTKSSTEGEDYNVAAVRAAFRVLAGTYVGLKGWDIVTQRMAARKAGDIVAKPPARVPHYNARVAGSLSSILLLHRLLHRFFRRFRAALLEPSAAPFRERNPRIAQILTSQYTPAVGAALAGMCLGIAPSDQLRVTIAIYVFTRSLEFGFNALEESGMLWSKEKGRPWWFGSWMIMPFACGQLLHAFVLDRECFPENYGRFILQRSPEYVQRRPSSYPADKPWPSTFDIVDALAEISKLKWPAFASPILFPTAKEALPAAIAKVRPITAPAHPGITQTSCALLHPHDPSCSRTYVKYWIAAFPQVARFFTLIYGGFALLAYKRLLKDPSPVLSKLISRILRISIFLTGAIGTAWGSVCLFGRVFPRSLLSTQRWFLGGFLGGLWAFVAQGGERGNFLYSARVSIDSLYKVGKKRGWWRGVKNGDVFLFVASLALLDFVYEVQPSAVRGAVLRKGMGTLRGEGWVDRAARPVVAGKGQAKDDTRSDLRKEE